MFPGGRLQGVALTWRTSSVDSTVVVLAEGEVQRLARFGNKLFPGFGRSFPHPAVWNSGGTFEISLALNISIIQQTEQEGSADRSSILLESCVRISAERLW